MKIIKKNSLGLKIPEAEKHLNAKYLNELSVKNEDGEWSDFGVSMFYSENPDTDKGHKHYPFLYFNPSDEQMYVGAFDEIDDETRYVSAVHCEDCDELIYSVFRHDYVACSCEKHFIDGGRNYIRTSSPNVLKFDVIENKVVDK